METINNMAASAAKAVWGENKTNTTEPVSGRYGDTTKGEPYDAGNIEPTSARVGEQAYPNGGFDDDDTHARNYTYGDATADDSGDAAQGLTQGDSASDAARFSKPTGTAAESYDTSDNNSSANLKPDSSSSRFGDSSKGQADTRTPEDPLTNPKSAPIDVNDRDEEGINEAQNLDGPGPKPVAELAREHGGDAGRGDDNINSTSSSSSVAAAAVGDSSKSSGKEATHESEGTGEKLVRASGLHADGGDFDATKPGAGREADRLMEEKGMHHSAGPNDAVAAGAGDEGSSASPTSRKKSISQKIKDKLHRH